MPSYAKYHYLKIMAITQNDSLFLSTYVCSLALSLLEKAKIGKVHLHSSDL